ncbi:MAG: GNAT family N-acetyltransferase [Croceibacterium sp.]
MTDYRIMADDLSGPEVAALLALHLAEMHANTPLDQVHALPIERLRAPDVTFYSAWAGAELAAVGALKQLGPECGELKSMRAAPAFRGRGAGEAILLALMAEARHRGYRWLGLETGRTGPFAPAVALYRKHGFATCEPFGDYLPGDFSQCFGRAL